MRNIMPGLTYKKARVRNEDIWLLPGCITGFVSYWFALAIPFLRYDANFLFFLLYTWPFFLALLPVSVLTGMVFGLLFRDKLFLTILFTLIVAGCLLWLLFIGLTGW